MPGSLNSRRENLEKRQEMPEEHAIQSVAVRQLTKLVEESTRATGESVKYFIEPTPGVLDKAKNKRHHIIFVSLRQGPPCGYGRGVKT